MCTLAISDTLRLIVSRKLCNHIFQQEQGYIRTYQRPSHYARLRTPRELLPIAKSSLKEALYLDPFGTCDEITDTLDHQLVQPRIIR